MQAEEANGNGNGSCRVCRSRRIVNKGDQLRPLGLLPQTLKGIVTRKEMRIALAVRSYISSKFFSVKLWLMAGTRLMAIAAVKIVAKLMRGTDMPVR